MKRSNVYPIIAIALVVIALFYGLTHEYKTINVKRCYTLVEKIKEVYLLPAKKVVLKDDAGTISEQFIGVDDWYKHSAGDVLCWDIEQQQKLKGTEFLKGLWDTMKWPLFVAGLMIVIFEAFIYLIKQDGYDIDHK